VIDKQKLAPSDKDDMLFRKKMERKNQIKHWRRRRGRRRNH
jgi:hypothetical protein